MPFFSTIDPFVIRINPPLREIANTKTLDQLTFGVKGIIPLKGYPLHFGNKIWDEMHRTKLSEEHAQCVDDLLKAGAALSGTLHTTEFAFDIKGISLYGIPLNPKARDRVPGGSSSGSASAVASGAIDFALGTDTGGSIRIPASYCGVWSLRPTKDIISVEKILAVGSCYDTVGIIAKDAVILDKVTQVLFTRKQQPTEELQRLYVITETFDVCQADIKQLFIEKINQLSELYPVRWISIDEITHEENSNDKGLGGWQDAARLLLSNTWETLQPWLEKNIPNWQQADSPITESVRANLHAGKEVSEEFKNNPLHKKQLQVRVNKYKLAIDEFLTSASALLLPTTPHAALAMDAQLTMQEFMNMIALTSIASLTGFPQLHMPIVEDKDARPLGLSLIGRPNHDKTLLQAAVRIEAHLITKYKLSKNSSYITASI